MAALNGSLLFTLPSHLPPLTAETSVPVRGGRTSRPRLHVWLAFDGTRGRILARMGRGAPDFIPSHADATSASAAAASRGRAAVAFVQWDGRTESLRVASRAGRGWKVTTLDRNAAPIWSQQVELTRDGTVLAGWIDVVGQSRRLVFADKLPGRRWSKPTQLDAGNGLGSFAFASERRLLTARFDDGTWNRPRVVATQVGGPTGRRLGEHRRAGGHAA